MMASVHGKAARRLLCTPVLLAALTALAFVAGCSDDECDECSAPMDGVVTLDPMLISAANTAWVGEVPFLYSGAVKDAAYVFGGDSSLTIYTKAMPYGIWMPYNTEGSWYTMNGQLYLTISQSVVSGSVVTSSVTTTPYDYSVSPNYMLMIRGTADAALVKKTVEFSDFTEYDPNLLGAGGAASVWTGTLGLLRSVWTFDYDNAESIGIANNTVDDLSAETVVENIDYIWRVIKVGTAVDNVGELSLVPLDPITGMAQLDDEVRLPYYRTGAALVLDGVTYSR